MSWFKNWFDSKYYHILYKDRDKKEAELFINNLIKFLNLKHGSRILDVACGKGRHAMYFNSLGFKVVGIDISHKSIQFAKKYQNSTLDFVIHDMRQEFQNNNFDLVTNLFTSFGYFKKNTDEKKAINSMANSMKKDGLLVIDFMNIEKVKKKLVAKEKKIIDNVTFDISRKIINGHIIKDIIIRDLNTENYFQEKVKTLDLYDFSNLIKEANMRIVDTFGNYNLDKFNASKSDRLILICKK
tara:strand:+ start:2506 stop:3228 length:723 start_codon:yes stop_codon:yes gene_type:complete